MSTRSKRRNAMQKKQHRHHGQYKKPGRRRIPTLRVKLSDEIKSRVVALWCHLSQQEKRAYPFHFVKFYGDLTLFCQGLVHARDAVDAWKVAVSKLRDSAKYPEYPGEMSEEEVAQLIAIENVSAWDDTFKRQLLLEALAFAENQLSVVGGQHFKSSPATKLTHSILDAPSAGPADPHPLAH